MCKADEMTPDWLNVLADEPAYSVMFTSRGVVDPSSGPYDGFNLCHYTGDDVRHIATCRLRIATRTGIDLANWVIPRQTHSDVIRVVDSLPVEPSGLEGVDGLVTRLRGVAIGVSTADCVPVVMVDPHARVIGAVHAGWRGAVSGIIANGVRAMLSSGASVGRMKAYIGPAICADCFEVGEEVACHFPEECVRRFTDGRRPHVDLPAFACRELYRCGLPAANVAEFDPRFCTRCHPDRYFSARYAGINSGRNFTFVVLKPV